MRSLVFFSLFPIAFSSFIGNNRDVRYAPSLDALEGQGFRSRLTRIAGMKVPQYYHGDRSETLAILKDSSHTLQRRGACMGKSGCGNSRNRTPDRTTRSTGTQTTAQTTTRTTTPPNSPREQSNVSPVVPIERTPSQQSIPALTNSESRRSNSFTGESRDKVGELSRTNTGIKSDLHTPSNSRTSSAESRRQSAASSVSYADSIGMLQGDTFVPHEQRRQRMDGSGSRRPSSAGSALPRMPTARLPERPASAETVFPKGSRRPSSAGSRLLQIPTTQQSERPASASTVSPKGWAAGSEQSYGSRRSSTMSDISAYARWTSGG